MYRIQRVLLLPLGGKLFWYERLSQLTQCAPSSPFLFHPSAPLATSVMPVVKSVLKRVSGRV